MSRPIVLSNNHLFVGLDNFGLVNDFYFPYVGQNNLTTARTTHHKIGIFVDNVFSWVNDGEWEINIKYLSGSLISDITMLNKRLQVKLVFNDYIDHEFSTFIRHIKIYNEADYSREIRIFMHQVFMISPMGRGDTVLYVPDKNYIYDYKGKVSLIINGKFDDGKSFDQYTVGNYNIEGKQGTYKDAEDGNLSNNPVEHSSVDSTIRFKKLIPSKGEATLDYWIIATENVYDGRKLNDYYMTSSLNDRLNTVNSYWQNWVNPIKSTELKNKDELINSLLIIKAHTDANGSIIASGDSSIFNYGRDYYAYCWPRDGSYALWPLIRLKYFEEAKNFFNFCVDVISPEGYLMHKYQPDKSVGSTWHSLIYNGRHRYAIQEDETAIVVYMLEQYYNESKDLDFIKSCYKKLIEPAANFMASYIDINTGLPHASYDLWEEKFLTTTYTTSVVQAALKSAINLAKLVGDDEYTSNWQNTIETIETNFDKLLYDQDLKYYVKGLILNSDNSYQVDKTVDISSLYGVYMFKKISLDDSKFLDCIKTIESTLKYPKPGHGVARYLNDNYFTFDPNSVGNPWILTTLWLSQMYLSLGRIEDGQELIGWVTSFSSSSGTLSEQRNPYTNTPIGVDPLVWSHAELVNTIIDLNTL